MFFLTHPSDIAVYSTCTSTCRFTYRTGWHANFGRGGDSVGLDPSHEIDGESFKVCENIYDTLLQYKDGSTELEPALATSWENSEGRSDLDFPPSARRNLS